MKNYFNIQRVLCFDSLPVIRGVFGGMRGFEVILNFGVGTVGVSTFYIGFYLGQLYIIPLSFLRGTVASHAVTTGWYCSGRCWQQVGTKFYFGGKFIFIEFWFLCFEILFHLPALSGVDGSKNKKKFFEWWLHVVVFCSPWILPTFKAYKLNLTLCELLKT